MCVVYDITDRCAFDGFHIHIEKCEAQNKKEKKEEEKRSSSSSLIISKPRRRTSRISKGNNAATRK
jgi:hypothetical protein